MQESFSVKLRGSTIGKLIFASNDAPDRLEGYSSATVSDIEKNFYEKFYALGATPLDRTRKSQHEAIWHFFSPHIHVDTRPEILDIGCGRGGFVRMLQEKLGHGGTVYGIEPALKQETPNLKRASMADVGAIPGWPKKFSVISMLDVFEHFANPADAIDQLTKILVPRGQLLLKVPNKNSLSYLAARRIAKFFPNIANSFFLQLFQLRYPPPHYFYHSQESIHALLEPRFRVIASTHLTEVPLAGLFTRFWYLPRILRPIVIPFVLVYRLLSLGRYNDSIVVLAELNE